MSGATMTLGQTEARQPDASSVGKAESRSPLNFSRRIPELDGLRGVAIGMIVFLHCVSIAIVARPPQLLGYVYATTQLFWSGVDLFFVLSGFLIGGILLDARDSPNYFKTFYIRRFCRILPIYLLFIGLVALAYRFVYRPVGAPLDWLFANRLPWYSYLSFAQNLWMSKHTELTARALVITWSLAIEEQFYLVLPIIIRLVRRPVLPFVFIAGIVIAPIARLFVFHYFPAHPWAGYLLLPCRVDSLFLGTLCAYSLRNQGVSDRLVQRRTSLRMMFFVLLAGMALLTTASNPPALLMMAVGYSWIAFFYATALILALTDTQSLLSRALRWRWLGGLGVIAYSVYLFHATIYGLSLWLFTRHGLILATWKDLGATLLAVAMTIALGKLSWRYFEKPIVRWGHTWQY